MKRSQRIVYEFREPRLSQAFQALVGFCEAHRVGEPGGMVVESMHYLPDTDGHLIQLVARSQTMARVPRQSPIPDFARYDNETERLLQRLVDLDNGEVHIWAARGRPWVGVTWAIDEDVQGQVWADLTQHTLAEHLVQAIEAKTAETDEDEEE